MEVVRHLFGEYSDACKSIGRGGVVVVSFLFFLVAALYYLPKYFFVTKQQQKQNNAIVGRRGGSSSTSKKTPICPFSKDTNFIVEVAATVPLAPLEEMNYSGPNAARWLAYGISGQDTPGKLRAGLKRLRDSTYFLVEDDNLAVELAMKERNFQERREVCFVMEDDSRGAQREVLDLFLSYLPRRYPNIYTYDTKLNTIHVKLDDNTTKVFRIEDYAHAPLELCELIVQEDLILMRPGKVVVDTTTTKGPSSSNIQSYHMAAAAVVFSFRELAQKLSQPAEFIHAPVPHFRDHIQTTLNLMFSTLSAEKPLWRNNWGIASTDKLDEPLYGSATAHEERRMLIGNIADVKHKYFLKVEYQTIRRLPQSNYLLFTVKTMVNRLDELESMPTAAACLASSIRGMSTAMHRYKGIDDDATCTAILRYLDTIGGAASKTKP